MKVIMRDAYKDDNSIVIKWESEVSNILGFRVVYRLFGKPEFKQGPPLAPSEREFRIKNVPSDVSGPTHHDYLACQQLIGRGFSEYTP